MKRVLVLFFCAIFLPAAVQAAVWPLGDTVLTAPGARSQPYFVYVPSGKRFDAVHLQGRIVGSGQSNVLAIYLDGRLVKTLRPRDGNRLDVALPNLTAGFHRIVLSGSPTTRAPEHQVGVQCPPLYSLPMSVEDMVLQYRPQQMHAPWLAELPDGLFNRSYPGKKPWLGAVVLDPSSTVSETAALRLAGDFSANAGLRFTVGDDPRADFEIVLKRTEQIGAAAQMTIREPAPVKVDGKTIMRPRVPTLTIAYGTTASLDSAVNALLNKAYRLQLRTPQARVSGTVAEPQWGVLQSPSTLAELGLTDISVIGNQKLDLALAYPTYWQPTGPIKGRLLLRSQAGLPDDAHLNVWLNRVLAGSIPLEHLDSGDIQRTVKVDGARTPDSTNVGLKLDAILDHHAFCQQPAPGNLWVDAQKSTLKLPHRDKAGIMQLLPALVARPLITTDGSAAALDAALAVVQAEGSVTGDLPLPYRVVAAGTQSDAGGAAPVVALHIAVDPKAVKVFANAQAPRINPAYVEHAVWLHVAQDGRVNMLASRAESLRALAAIWPKAVTQIPDGALDALVDTDSGQVLVLRTLPSTAVKPGGHMSDRQYQYGVAIVLGSVVLFALVLLWLSRRRRGVR